MASPGLESLGSNGNTSRKRETKKAEDKREVLDVSKPFDICYCCFDTVFFNMGTQTLSLENHFSAGDRHAEGVVSRMIMHPGAVVELVLESRLIPGKVTTALLFNPKNVTPDPDKYRSQFAEKPDGQ